MSAQANPYSAGVDPDPAAKHAYFAEAVNSGDVDRLADLYEPDAIVVERTGELTRGIAAIRDHITSLVSLRPTMRILGSTAVINGDVAQLSSWWHMTATAPDGTPIEMEFHGSELDRRQPDGSWRIAIDNPWGASAGSEK